MSGGAEDIAPQRCRRLANASISSYVRTVRRWDWLGVGEQRWTKADNEEVRPAKTAWDWLQLAVVPIVLALIAIAFNAAQASRDSAREAQRTREDRAIAARRTEEERALAADVRRADVLHDYLNRMADLMLDHNLLRSRAGSELQTVARSVTLAALRRLDGDGRGQIVRFLAEAGLMGATPANSGRVLKRKVPGWVLGVRPIVALWDADLTGAKLADADLTGGVLYGAHLVNAQFESADLSGTNFDGAELTGADFDGATLDRASLVDSRLEHGSFRRASLRNAVLINACLSHTTFAAADLSNASVFLAAGSHIDFTGAQLRGLDIRDGSLTNVEFEKAHVGRRPVPDVWRTPPRLGPDPQCVITNRPKRLP
jgi:uncharacterized protein YjbI with pentapeptide repeats